MKVCRTTQDVFILGTEWDFTEEGLTVEVWDMDADEKLGAETETWSDLAEEFIEDTADRMAEGEMTRAEAKQELNGLARALIHLSEKLEAAAGDL